MYSGRSGICRFRHAADLEVDQRKSVRLLDFVLAESGDGVLLRSNRPEQEGIRRMKQIARFSRLCLPKTLSGLTREWVCGKETTDGRVSDPAAACYPIALRAASAA
jgi:hypothetical protein